MRYLQLQRSIWWLVLPVAIIGALPLLVVALLFYPQGPICVVDLFTEDPFNATRDPIRKVWDAGPHASVAVDLFEGWIWVVPGGDGEVAVEIKATVYTKQSQAAADRALRAIKFELHREGDSIKIAAKGRSAIGIDHSIFAKISVPNGVDLDLRTGRGNIDVGMDHIDRKWVDAPVVAASIRARNESPYQGRTQERGIYAR
jgi:hypothetical protein